MRSIAHHDYGQKPERMKFLRILFGCPEGAGKWRILLFLLCFCIAKISRKEKIVSAEHAADTAFLIGGLFLKPESW